MKTNRLHTPPVNAFTLIEMIGVLAVIAILASLLVPKVFEAINNARINNAALSYNTVKTAIVDHYAKFGSLLSSNGTVFTAGVGVATNFDRVLVSEGFLDKPFHVKLASNGTNSYVRVVPALSAVTAADAVNAAYSLTGNSAVNDAVGAAVTEVVIVGASEADAKELNDRIDGPALGSALGTSDLVGRVKYATGSTAEIHIYITHR